MRLVLSLFLLISSLLASPGAFSNAPDASRAQAAAPARQDLAALRQSAEQFLQRESQGLPGQVQVNVGAIDPRLSLPACSAVQGFLPAGSRAWGKTSVGLRCTAPSPWTVYVSAQVQVQGEYVVAAVPLAQGQLLQAGDLGRAQGDLGILPPGVLTDPAQAIGQTVTRSLALGAPLRADLIKGQQVVSQGQVVRLVGNGRGFKVTSEGRSLSNGSEGQTVQARAANGQMVSGIARAGGTVEVNW
jgi:flagella basal body P-ring formation protein FlgA